MEFEENLWINVEIFLAVNLNRNYWEEFDELDNETLMGINRVINEASAEIIKKYAGTGVVQIIDRINSEIKMMIRVGMNVPFPVNPDFHIDRVIHNTHFEVNYLFADLYSEMLKVNDSARKLQSTWRRAISDPNYLACRRRLEYEFMELDQEINLRI